MKDPMGVSPGKGNQGQRKNYFDLGGNRTHDLRIRTTVTLPTELRGRTEKTTSGLDLLLLCRLSYEVGQRKSGTIKAVNRVVSIPTEVKRIFSLPRVVP